MTSFLVFVGWCEDETQKGELPLSLATGKPGYPGQGLIGGNTPGDDRIMPFLYR